MPVGPTDTVRLVTNDFMYIGGGDGYTALAGGTDVLTPGDGLLEISIEWVTAHSPVAPQIEGRVDVARPETAHPPAVSMVGCAARGGGCAA